VRVLCILTILLVECGGVLRQDTLILQNGFQGWAVGLVTRKT